MSTEIRAHKGPIDGPVYEWYLVRDNGPRVAIDGNKTWATKALLEQALRSRKKKLDKNLVVTDLKPRGRPRVYTPEEALERRRESVRASAQRRKERAPEKVAEAAREYRLRNPEKQKELQARSYARKKERLATDPAYRERINAYQREYTRRKRAQEAK